MDTHGQYQLLPALTGDEYEALKTDIAARGVQVPVEYDEAENILDGHHRVKACLELGITEWPRIVRVGMTEADKIDHVLALNLDRRHLSREQRQALVATLREQGWSMPRIAGRLKIGVGTVSRDIDAAPFPNGKPDTVTGADGKQYPATQPEPRPQPVGLFNPTERDIERAQDWQALVATAEPVLTVLDGAALRKTYRETAEARAKDQVHADPPPLPEGKYRCLVIDPPWDVQKVLRDERPNQDALDYPTMTDAEIMNLPIADLADPEGCHVYLWVTHKKLPVGLDLFEEWGVKYQCMMTWVKNVGFTPFSWMYSTEHVLFGRIGKLDLLRLGMRLDFSAPVTRHSEKPPVFYERVIEASPEPRLEMFARQRRDGFDAWGNEA